MKDWDINIYRGILTGYNEAFIINGKTKDELIRKSPKNAEIIRPILRGRDIKRYGYEFADLWLICTHNGTPTESAVDIDDYPDIKVHLDNYHTQLTARQDKGITPYNLRSCIYMDDFSKQKIIYPEITKFINFHYDTEHFVTNNKCFILTGRHLEFLTAFLNSSLFKYCFIDNFPELLGGTRELRKIFIEKIPIIQISDADNTQFIDIVSKIQQLKRNNLESEMLERTVDDLIYDLYELTDEERGEIGFIKIR